MKKVVKKGGCFFCLGAPQLGCPSSLASCFARPDAFLSHASTWNASRKSRTQQDKQNKQNRAEHKRGKVHLLWGLHMAGAWLVCFKWAQECNPSGIAPLGALLWGIPMGDAREQNRAEQSRTEQNTKRAGVAHCKGHRLGSCALDEPKSTIRGGNQLHGPCMGSSMAIPMMDANSRAGTACMCVPMEWIAATTGVAHSTGGPHVIKQAKKCTPSGKNMQELRLLLKIHSRAEQEQNRAEQEQNRKFDTKECDFHSGQWAVGFRG